MELEFYSAVTGQCKKWLVSSSMHNKKKVFMPGVFIVYWLVFSVYLFYICRYLVHILVPEGIGRDAHHGT